MRKIIKIISLAIGLIVCFNYFFFGQRVELEYFYQEPFLCEGQPCNVILIIPESTSARHMGIYGYERDTTPFIDEFFGKEGIVFESAWSNSNWTNPSFASLFTSQLPSEIFVETWGDKLSDEIPTFIDVLTKAGTPKFAAHTLTLFPGGIADFNLATQFNSKERFMGTDDELFKETIEWIKKQNQPGGKRPFFLLLQTFLVHWPYDPPEPYRYFFDASAEYAGSLTPEDVVTAEDVETENQRARLQYDQSIRYLDSQIQSFISQIPEDVLRNTAFIFISDHGRAFLQHGNIHGALYEEEIHIPFIIRAPGIKPKTIKEPVTLLDVGPTILEIFGFKSPETFKGISLLPICRGEKLQLEERIIKAEVVYYYARHPGILIPDPWVRKEPLLFFMLHHVRINSVRKGEWKLLQREHHNSSSSNLELYNLEQDYYEQNNLISRWHSLSQEERMQVIYLLEALGEKTPF